MVDHGQLRKSVAKRLTMASKPNAQYWADRATQRMVEAEQDALMYQLRMANAWQRADDALMDDINRLMRKFGHTYDMDADEALALLAQPITDVERNTLLIQAAQIEDVETRMQVMARVNAPAYKARMTRLQALREQAAYRYAQIAPEHVAILASSLTATAVSTYYKTVFDTQRGTGLAYSFANLTERDITEVLKQAWSGEHYRTSVWKNTDILAERLPDILQENLTTGRSWRRSLDEVSDLSIKQGNYTSSRLLRTETAYVHNEIEAEAMRESGVEWYTLIATLDGRTSSICQEKDGKRYKLKDRSVGTNYPPFHPHCRTVAAEDDINLKDLQRRARDPITGKTYLLDANIKYPEWRASLVDQYGLAAVEAGEEAQRLRAKIT